MSKQITSLIYCSAVFIIFCVGEIYNLSPPPQHLFRKKAGNEIDRLDEKVCVLVFAPHPDDDVIGCGGTIAKHIARNHTVTIVYLTSGEKGGPKKLNQGLASIRENEAQEAGNLLGVSDLIFLRFPNRKLSCADDSVNAVIAILKEKRPNIIYMPHQNDMHSDHKATNAIVMQAVSLLRFSDDAEDNLGRCRLYGYEVWTPLQKVSHRENISAYIDLKMKAVQRHRSQITYDRSYDEASKGLNRYRGIMLKCGDYCECFEVLSPQGK